MKKLIVLIAVLGVATFSVSSADAAGIRSIGVGAGYASPDNIDGTWTAGLHLDIGVPVMNLYFQPFVGYWTKGADASVAGVASITGDISNWFVGGNLKYGIPTAAAKVHPYIQGGVSMHRISSDISSSLLGQSISTSVSDTKVGFQFGGGLSIDVGDRWGLFSQGEYHLVSDFNQWMIGGGVQINM